MPKIQPNTIGKKVGNNKVKPIIMNPDNEMIISYNTMRKATGWLGMLLPFVLLFGNYIINHLDILNNPFWVITDHSCVHTYTAAGSFKSSISHYYYSTVGEIFTGTLCAVALFMFCYKGHPLRPGEKGLSDSFVTNAAGLFALGVVVFPTSSDCCITDNSRSFLSSQTTGNIHFTFAALFFVALAYMCLVNFRRTGSVNVKAIGASYTLYFICGLVMLSCMAILIIYTKWLAPEHDCDGKYHVVFILETISLIAFGISWLRKGDADFMYLFKIIGIAKK